MGGSGWAKLATLGGVFRYSFESVTGTAVLLFTGDRNDDSDFERYLAAIDDLDAKAGGRDDALVLTVVDPGNPPPDAVWRKRIAARSRTLRTRATSILVSDSPLVRGVVTVLDWLAPKRFREQVTVATFEEALAWVARRQIGREVVLRRLLDEARREGARLSSVR